MTPETLTAASLCSGYGGLEMGAAMVLSLNVRLHAEVDPDASRVLKRWWPEVPNLGDFTTPDFWAAAERVDVELGGIPCQPFSAAGRQAGEEDPRHLWPHWLRGIRRRMPSMIVLENVAGLTRGKMRPTFDAICLALADLGYSVRWCLLGACAVGAAHHRHRVFLVAKRVDGLGDVREVKVATCGQRGAAYLPTPRGRDWKIGGYEDTLSAVAIALLPTPRAIDAARGPVTVERTASSGRKNGVELASALQLLPTPRHSDAKNGGPNQGIAYGDIALSSTVQPERWGKYADAIARHEAVLGRPAPEATEIGPRDGRRLAAVFSEWLMMLPEGHLTSVLERNPALARAGNGVVPLQAAQAITLLLQSY